MLRRLYLPIVIGNFNTVILLETSLLLLIELAILTLTYLTLDTKGLI